MIAWIWRSTTTISNAKGYQEYLYRFVVPAYQMAEGNNGVYVMKECQGDLVHFLLLTYWTSNEALTKNIGVPGDGINPSPEERKLLIAYESIGRSYKVIESPKKGEQNVH